LRVLVDDIKPAGLLFIDTPIPLRSYDIMKPVDGGRVDVHQRHCLVEAGLRSKGAVAFGETQVGPRSRKPSPPRVTGRAVFQVPHGEPGSQ
jgi:hypothetical protein